MKICIVNNLYKPLSRGGAEKNVEILAKQFQADGHDVFVVATSPVIKDKPNKNYEIIYIENIKVYFIKAIYFNLNKIPVPARLFWHIWDMFDFISLKKIKKVFNNEKPDVIITNNLKGISYMLPEVIYKLKIKHIHILHDIQLLYPSGILMYGQENKMKNPFVKLYIFICGYLFAKVKNVISPSDWLLNEHKKRNFFKISKNEIIRTPFDFSAANKMENDNNLLNKKYTFIFIGQIEKHKGILFLIKCFNKFSVNKNTELHVLGDGKALNEAKIMANNKVIFYGRVEQDKVRRILGKTDCLVVPSLCYENSPSVLYEAIAFGLPAIASNIGGITELMQDYGGLLFEPGNESELIAKMDWILINHFKNKKEYFIKHPDIEKYNKAEYAQKIIKLL